jgi:hypothetical protein
MFTFDPLFFTTSPLFDRKLAKDHTIGILMLTCAAVILTVEDGFMTCVRFLSPSQVSGAKGSASLFLTAGLTPLSCQSDRLGAVKLL